MVDAISGFSPTTFLDTIKGKTAPVAPVKPTTPVKDSGATTGSLDSDDVISVVQNLSSASQKGGLVSDIVGSASVASSDPLAGVYNSFLKNKSSASPLKQALDATQQKQARDKASSSAPLQRALTTLHAGSNAYNKVLQQNAQAVLNNSKGLIA